MRPKTSDIFFLENVKIRPFLLINYLLHPIDKHFKLGPIRDFMQGYAVEIQYMDYAYNV